MPLRYRRLFWDLDGTLTDPREGFIGSVVPALRELGIEPDPAALERLIGPPLRDGLRRLYSLDDERIEQAMALYRARFDACGWRENRLYPGIPALLARLAAAGVPMAVATSKPTVFAERVVGASGLAPWFVAVQGASLDGRAERKLDVLARASAGLSRTERAASLMIGDHAVDIEAAHALGLRALAVTYGYGLRSELAAARPDAWADSVGDLANLLVGPREGEDGSGEGWNMQK